MNTMICRGRFMLDSRPVPSPLARSGYLYEWYVIDFDSDAEEVRGIADSQSTAFTVALTTALAMR
jgi:hypothetical protein